MAQATNRRRVIRCFRSCRPSCALANATSTGQKQNTSPDNSRITTHARAICPVAMQRRARCIAPARAATTLHNHTKKTRKIAPTPRPTPRAARCGQLRAPRVLARARRAYDPLQLRAARMSYTRMNNPTRQTTRTNKSTKRRVTTASRTFRSPTSVAARSSSPSTRCPAS